MSVNRASEVWKEIKPFAIRDMNSMLDAKSGDSGDDLYAIILYDESAQKIKYYAMSSDGLQAALAAASSDDVVWIPAGTLTGDFVISKTVIGLDRKNTILSGNITIDSGAQISNLSFFGQVSASHLCLVTNCDFSSTSAPSLTLGGSIGDSPYIMYCQIRTLDNSEDKFTVVCNGYSFVQYCTILSQTNAASIDYWHSWFSFCRFHAGGASGNAVNLGDGRLDHCDLWSQPGHALSFTQNGKSAVVTNSKFESTDETSYGLNVTETGLELTDCNWNTVSGEEFIKYGLGDRMPANGSFSSSSFSLHPSYSGKLKKISGSVTVTDDSSHNGFPGMCLTSTGDLLLVYRKAANHAPSKGTIVKKTSSDNGATWSAESTVISDATYDVREPQVTKLSNGNIVLVYGKASATEGAMAGDQAFLKVSDDDGATWGSEINITTNFTTRAGASAPVVELPNGNLLLPVYGLDSGDSNYSSEVYISDDGGATWSFISRVADGETDSRKYSEPNVVLCANGELLCLMRSDTPDQNSGNFYASWSVDLGVSWSEPIAVIQGTGRPHVICLSNGILLCIYRNRTDYDTDYQISYNNGMSWDTVITLWDSDLRSSYVFAVEYDDGLIGVAIGDEDADTDSNIIFVKFYLTFSTGQLESTVPTGISPLVVGSMTLVTNLNADLLDGYHASELVSSGGELLVDDDMNILFDDDGDILYEE